MNNNNNNNNNNNKDVLRQHYLPIINFLFCNDSDSFILFDS